MSKYTTITIIYNPHSTGGSERVAIRMLHKLRAISSIKAVTIVPTEHAGHAEELAYVLAKASSRPLIISVSGDGGYNEIINGVMRAKHEGATPITGLLPAGNANDHYHALHRSDFVTAVAAGKERSIDILTMTVTTPTKTYTQYAHSYIGVGLTPRVGYELNKTQLNTLKEAWIVGKSFADFRDIKLSVDGEIGTYRSLVFSNVNRMAKILTLTKDSKVDDGLFEASVLQHKSKLSFAFTLLKATVPGLYSTTQAKEFSFQTVDSTLMQLDGEVTEIDARADVIIGIEHKVLACIV
jgi:diacylglycerol kinase (ATP)